MENYKPNSHRSKELAKDAAKKEVKKVISGNAKVRKKSGASKFAETFISEDAVNIKSYVVMDVLIPAAKKAISDIVTNGIDMILYGETGHSKKRSSASYISYNKYSDRDRRDRSYRSEAGRVRAGFNYDDIWFETRVEADEVLEAMGDMLDTYDNVSIADMYDLAGVTCPNPSYNKYGWDNLRNADILRLRDGGYILKLPKAIQL